MLSQSKSVFYPVPTQFEDTKFFIKRDAIFRRLPKSQVHSLSCIHDQSQTLPIHDNQNNLKKKLQEYIQKEKNKISLRLAYSQFSFSKEKSKLIFREGRQRKHENTVSSTFFTPVDETKLSQQLLKSKKLAKRNFCRSGQNNVSKSILIRQKSRAAPRFDLRYGTEQVQKSHNQHITPIPKTSPKNCQSIQIPASRTLCIKKNKKSKALKINLLAGCQIIGNPIKCEVLICGEFKYDETKELERKKSELLKINQALKLRSNTKLKLHQRASSQMVNEVGPWSKMEDEAHHSNCPFFDP